MDTFSDRPGCPASAIGAPAFHVIAGPANTTPKHCKNATKVKPKQKGIEFIGKLIKALSHPIDVNSVGLTDSFETISTQKHRLIPVQQVAQAAQDGTFFPSPACSRTVTEYPGSQP